jgi:NADPH2:quinone reductase
MKAIRVDAPGGVERLRLVDAPIPTPGEGELLVQVAVAGVNFADTMLRRDAYFTSQAFPFVPGVEIGGTVAATGPGVTAFEVGNRVAGVILGGGGGYAEYCVASAAHCARVPAGLGFDQAVAALNQGLTAQGLLDTAPEVARGAGVLVTAAGGGVGGLLLQLARLGGAGPLFAAASDVAKLGLAGSLGASLVSYAGDGWPRQVRAMTGGRGVDVVFDGVGGRVREAAPRAVAPTGRIVFFGAASGTMGVTDAMLTLILGRNISLTGYSIHTSIAQDPAWLARTLVRIWALVLAGELKTPINPPYPLARAGEAQAAIESRAATGKILIAVS